MAADGGWGWVVVVGCCICHFFLIGINRSMGIIYVVLQERFEASATDTALAASIFVSVRAFGGPIGSKLSDRFGCRAVTMTGGFLLCIGLVLCSLATKLSHVYLALGIVAGVGGVLVFSPSYVAVSQWFDKKKGKAMALSTLGTGFGSVCMAPLMTLLVDEYGYFGTMLIVGALLFNNSVGGALYRIPPVTKDQTFLDTMDDDKRAVEIELPGEEEDSSAIQSSDTAPSAAENGVAKMRTTEDATSTTSSRCHDPSSQTETQDKTADGVQKTGESNSSDGGSKCLRVLRSWTNVPFIVYCLVVAGVQGSIQSILIFLPARAAELGAGPNAAALLLTLFGAFDMGGRFLFGFVFDVRAVRRRRSYLYTAVAATFGAITALLAAVGDYVVLAVGTCIVAVFEAGAHSQRATSVTELVEPSQVSLGVGLVILAQGFGNFYGPIVGGALRDRTGSYASGFVFGGTMLLAACVLMTIVHLVRCRRQPESVEQRQSC